MLNKEAVYKYDLPDKKFHQALKQKITI